MFDLSRIDTICALATAPQQAAVALIRVSGRDADAILHKVFVPKRASLRETGPKPFVATIGYVYRRENAQSADDPASYVDEALCTRFPDGKSYTGEPAFELSLHGSMRLVEKTLDLLCRAGCRIAQPGEFTLRAVLTGKLDLAAAEAVHDLVSARSDVAAAAALRHLRGGLADRLTPVRALIVDVLAEIEARLDYPDEDLGDAETQHILQQLQQARAHLAPLLASASRGKRLHQGARVVFYGPPNAGKSTLLNYLVGEEKSLVHDSPGTTRDAVEAQFIAAGIPITLIDVAGIRDHETDGIALHPVEKMGIDKARREVSRADLVCLVMPYHADDPELSQQLSQQRRYQEILQTLERDLAGNSPPLLVVLSKAEAHADTAAQSDTVPIHLDTHLPVLALSAHTGFGIDAFTQHIADLLGAAAQEHDEIMLAHVRQEEEALRADEAIHAAQTALLLGHVHEVVASELRQAGGALSRLLGGDLNEDVLDQLFSKFCIGK